MSTLYTDVPPAPKAGPEILGPWCEWPRREENPKRKVFTRTRLALGGSVAVAAGFVHCVLPLI